LVLYSNDGSYTSPIIAQADGDLLLVTGNGSSRNGNVGVGTISPVTKLHVEGGSVDNLIWPMMAVNSRNSSTISNYGVGLKLRLSNNNENKWAGIACIQESYWANSTGLALFANEAEQVRINASGNVGIGNTNPTEKLVVDGKILAEEVKVQTVPASDYVFEPDYALKPLQEVDQFIQQNKHLPDIPSAQEFKENGVGLGEMDDMLLRKVEELTLYVIELKKADDHKSKVIEELKEENQLLKTDILKEIETIKAQLK
jgi:hypothetical protein